MTLPPRFNLFAARLRNSNRPLQVMQHVGQRNNIEAPILDTIELVDFVAVKHKIKIVDPEHVTGNNVWQKSLQRRSAASYFQYGERCWIGKTLELITVEFTVPKVEGFDSH